MMLKVSIEETTTNTKFKSVRCATHKNYTREREIEDRFRVTYNKRERATALYGR